MATQATDSLANIVGAAQEFISGSISASKQIQENNAQIQQRLQRSSEIYKTVASDAAVVRATEAAAQLKVQAQNAQIARAAGIDPEAGANVLVETVAKLRSANAETEANLQEYRKKNETSILTNPIDWVVAQVTLPITEAKLEGSVKSSALYADQLTKVNNTLQNSFQTTAQLKESMSVASAESATRLAAAEATLNSEKTAIEAIKYNNLSIEAAQTASKEQLSAMYTVFNAQKAEQQMIMAQKGFALQLEKFAWEKEERAAARAAKEEGKAVDDMVIQRINLSRGSLGLPIISGTEAKSAVQLMKSGASKELSYHYENGSRISATRIATVGSTPAESIEVLQQIPNNLPDLRKETTAILEHAVAALQQNKTIDQKNRQAVANFLNTQVKKDVASLYNSITPNAQNPFDVGDLNSYLTLSGVKDLPVVTKLLGPLGASGQPLNDPKLVLGFLSDAMKKGTLTSSEIAGISTVYQKANLVNQTARGFVGFGIIPPNAGRNYNAKISPLGKPLDMTDPAAVQRYISTEAAKTMGNRISENRAANPFPLN